jgi:hypothetical protein
VKVEHDSPLVVDVVRGVLADHEGIATVAAKATLRIEGNYLVAVPEDERIPVISSPLELEGHLFDAEVHLLMRHVSFHLLGSAVAPNLRPVQHMQVVMRCGQWTHATDVFGDRVWAGTALRPVIGDPEPFATMPLGIERAFGGVYEQDGLSVPFIDNPAGRGFYRTASEALGQPLPNLERPHQRIVNWDDRPHPACLIPPIGSSLAVHTWFERDERGIPLRPTDYFMSRGMPDMLMPAAALGDALEIQGIAAEGPLLTAMPTATDAPMIDVEVAGDRRALPLQLVAVTVLARARALTLTFHTSFRWDIQGPMPTVSLRWQPSAYFVTEPPAATPEPGLAAPGPGAPLDLRSANILPITRPPIPKAKPLEPPPPPTPPLAPAGPWRVFQATPKGKPLLGITIRRSYLFDADGRSILAGEQLGPPDDREDHELELDHPLPRRLPEDVFKTACDVVVQGSAQTYGRPTRELAVEARVGGVARHGLVLGRRWVDLRRGQIEFTQPEPFEVVPLRYDLAYGGFDRATQQEVLASMKPELRAAVEHLTPATAAKFSLFGYPRNPVGRGYVLSNQPQRLHGVELPQLEDAADRLTPRRLIPQSPTHWPAQPLPFCFDLLCPTFFPRAALFGLTPIHEPKGASFIEIERGWLPRDGLRPGVWEVGYAALPGLLHLRASQNAALGLVADRLEPGDPWSLTHIHPARPAVAGRLPHETPRVFARVIGQASELGERRISAVYIDAEAGTLDVYWTAYATLPRALLPQELEAVAVAVEWS